MIKSIAMLLLLAVVGLLVYASTRPDTLDVKRSAVIAAPASRLFPLINDLRSFNTWNPYARKDPSMHITYSGPAAGAGAAFEFQGKKDAGKGRIAVNRSTEPSEVAMQLDMEEPMEGHNQITFSLVAEGDNSTRVVWAMHCRNSFLPKLAGIFIDMDQMIGKDFEAGLANLKLLAEKS